MTALCFTLSAVGCRQLVVSDGLWVKVDKENAIAAVKCNQTDETWYLTCKGNTWIGEIGNCSDGKASQ